MVMESQESSGSVDIEFVFPRVELSTFRVAFVLTVPYILDLFFPFFWRRSVGVMMISCEMILSNGSCWFASWGFCKINMVGGISWLYRFVLGCCFCGRCFMYLFCWNRISDLISLQNVMCFPELTVGLLVCFRDEVGFVVVLVVSSCYYGSELVGRISDIACFI